MTIFWHKPGAQREEGLWEAIGQVPRLRRGQQSVGSDVLPAGLKDDLKGSSSGVGCVSNRVPVQGWAVDH